MIVGVYLAIGIVVSLYIHSGPIRKFDSGVEGAGIFFRIIITPGMIALWPFVLRRHLQIKAGNEAPPDSDKPVPAMKLRARHGKYVTLIGILIPVMSFAILGVRQPEATNPAAALSEAGAVEVLAEKNPFPGFNIEYTIHRGSKSQLRMIVSEKLPLDEPMLYWMPNDRNKKTSEFVGPIYGPGVYTFQIPESMTKKDDGEFAILSFADGTALNSSLKEKEE